jgi:hypothetical protein
MEWTSEPELKRHPLKIVEPAGKDGRQNVITIVPDGAFTLRHARRTQYAFFEMDMGTIGHRRLRSKLRGYLLHQEQVRVPVFLVVPTNERLVHILEITDQEAERVDTDPSAVFVTCTEQVKPDSLLTECIWYQADRTAATAILPASYVATQDRNGAPQLPIEEVA